MTEIVKVHRPLGDIAKPRECLIYGNGRLHQQRQEVTLRVMAELAEDAVGYFNAEWSAGLQMWILGERAADQNW
jgi:hypothetical protein